MAESAKSILTHFLRRLTNISGNNKALVLLKLRGDQFVDVHSLSFSNGEPSFSIIKGLIEHGEKKICPVLDSRDESANRNSEKLKALSRIERFVLEERGTKDLHVAWPFVRGKFADGTIIRCPLLYFPVTLIQEGGQWVLRERGDAGISFNKSFLLAFAFYNKLKADDELLDFSFEDFPRDSVAFRTQLYQLIRNKIELNFNVETFHDELKPFEAFAKAAYEEQHKAGELKLFPEAVLGIFPQAHSQLVPDYLHLLEEKSFESLERFFEDKRELNEVQTLLKEEKLFAPFAIDAYQENAIQLIKQGNSIVVQGPPGTGKSQLICNLLADTIAAGKTALLVCQKRAALDVVYNRMKAMELDTFLGLVHDFRNDRREIFQKIARQIDRLDEYKIRNRDIDIIQTERKFFRVCRTIDQRIEELQEFKHALYTEDECGLSVKELYLTSQPHGDHLSLKQFYHNFKFPDVDTFLRLMKRYAHYASQFEVNDFVWRERKSFAALAASDERKIEEVIDTITTTQKEISTQLFREVGVELNLEEAQSLWNRKEEVLGMVSLLQSDEVYGFFQAMSTAAEDETSLLWLSNMERLILNCFDDDGPEQTIATDKLGKFQEALYERMKTRRNVLRLVHWELFSESKFLIKRVLVANDLSYNKYGLRILEQRIDNRLNMEHHLTALKKRVWLVNLPPVYDRNVLQHWFQQQKLAIKAKLFFNTLREIRESVNPQAMSRIEFVSLFKKLLHVVEPITSYKIEWQRYLSPYHIRQVIVNPEAGSELKTALHEHFDNLVDFDSIKEQLASHELEVIHKLHDHLEKWEGDKMEVLFQNSIRLSWIDHIELKYPILRSVSSHKMQELEQELQQLVDEKQTLSKEILLLRAREKAYEGVAYNRLSNRITYRDLHHQVTKKKKLWPLRKVIATHYDEIFQLLPVWMASPESVSAIFPMQQMFDLVIFDEASQCFAERGIPSMFRGKQVVVAGDSQQLRPNELYQVRWNDEEEDDPDAEVESLLALAARYLPTTHLQGHYRSKALELIEFSNQHFYNQRLQLLPDRIVMNSGQPSITFDKVNGSWENQRNTEEAIQVVSWVKKLLLEHSGKDIGVVTFNIHQQGLILDMLDSAAVEEGLRIPDSLFVKNIENVQGDERDIIIFSIGYAPDKKGKMAMQFGSLSMAGGENRLNVAVTRARERIIVVSSIEGEQLNVSETKQAGPKLLREYLIYAKQVSDNQFFPSSKRMLDNKASWYLNSHIKHWGDSRLQQYNFEINTLPFADVNVNKDDAYLGILLTDDERYFRSYSVKDSHVYTPLLLTSKNWRHKMVYSRNLWKDAEKLEKDLMLFIGSQDRQNG